MLPVVVWFSVMFDEGHSRKVFSLNVKLTWSFATLASAPLLCLITVWCTQLIHSSVNLCHVSSLSHVQLCVPQWKLTCSLCVSALPSSRPHGRALGLSASPLLWAALRGLGHAGLPADRLLSSGSRGELDGGRYGGDGGRPEQLGGGEERTLQQQQHPEPEPGALDVRRAVLLQGPPSRGHLHPVPPQEPVSGLEGPSEARDTSDQYEF